MIKYPIAYPRICLSEIETTEGIEWIATYPDIKGCVGGGKTKDEAILEAKENLAIHLQFLEEDNK